LLLVAACLLAPWPGEGAVRALAPSETLAVRTVPGGACVESPTGSERCLELESGALLHAAVPRAEGWIAAGTQPAGRHRDLLLLAERRGEVEALPPPPTGRGGPRGVPALLATAGELVGLAWLEGTHAGGLAVWASAWREGAWSPPQQIAPPGPRLALTGAVLADGRWLLVWTEFDGVDDETLYTIGRPGSWRSPQRLHAANEVPDIQPSLIGAGAGALVAWSRFDGHHYRLHLARLEPRGWRELGQLPGAGATRADFLAAAEGPSLLYRSVEPEAWHLAELDPRGRVTARLQAGETTTERPVVHLEGAAPWLEWPGGEQAPSPAPPATPTTGEVPTGSTFRYMAFGDSITTGNSDECNPDCDDQFSNCGYPTRLPTDPYLDCDTNDCEVVNKGRGGEATAEGVTRIQDVLDDEGPWDEVLLMEGTNDVCWEHDPSVSNDTIEFNLGAMESLAALEGVETLHASIIHINDESICPSDLPDPEGRVADLRDRIRDHLANVDADT
ncbi:MAG: GDSL-type esterase/lipase family protein, partial [Actinomycetota bacterium]